MHGGTLDDIGIVVSEDVKAAQDELVELRRDIHMHPELAFKESRTQKKVMAHLEACGIEWKVMASTGVLGTIYGRAPGKTVLMRADMDALPIVETADLPFKSRNEGVMHACGHDAHTAILLGVASILSRRGGIERGTCKLMFQPAEEGEGGAIRMIEEGILENPKVDAAFAFHVWTPFEVGEVAAREGAQAASVDGFRLRIEGKGTHAARPDEGVDPIAIAAQVVSSAQMLLTRRVSPTDPAVLSFTKIEAGTAFNIIPSDAVILGTIRTYDTSVRDTIVRGLESLAKSIAEALGGSAELNLLLSHPPVINDAGVVKQIRSVATDLVGPSRLLNAPPLMVGEDMGEVLSRVPGALALLGAGNPEIGADHPHHHPSFAIDERVLPIGVELGIQAIQALLGE